MGGTPAVVVGDRLLVAGEGDRPRAYRWAGTRQVDSRSVAERRQAGGRRRKEREGRGARGGRRRDWVVRWK